MGLARRSGRSLSTPFPPEDRELRKRLLIVDPDLHSRLNLESFFTAYGYETTVARTDAEAVALLKSGIPIDFVILDLTEWSLRESALVALFRSQPARRVPPPVALITNAPTLVIFQVAAVFRKPVPVLELLSVVQEHLGASARR